MTATLKTSMPLAASSDPQSERMSVIGQIIMMSRRSLVLLLRSPAEFIPSIAIGVFFLLIFDASLGRTANFLPDLRGVDYIAFILPLSVINAALGSPAGQAMVRDLENGYFDKLLLTPINRGALLLGHIIAGGVLVAIQTMAIIAVALVLGLEPATGIGGILATLGFAVFIGAGFGGFTVGVALRTNSAAATQGASFIFFPLSFLTTSFFPLDYLQGWLKIAAQLNPITYVLDGIRELMISGWDTEKLLIALFAATTISIFPFLFALFSLRARVKRT